MRLIKENTETTKCALCKKEIKGYGNNGRPLVNGRVCDECNKKVIKTRVANLTNFKITEAKKKRKPKQGYFVKYNAGNPEQNQAIFNKNTTPNTSVESSNQGLGEEYLSTMQGLKEFAEMTRDRELCNNVDSQLKLDREKNESLEEDAKDTIINIKKELNDIDWENDLALSDMYYSMNLSDEEKKEVAHLINERNIDKLKNYIENLYKKSVDLDIEENEILSELNNILAIASKGSFEVKEESDKNTVIDMLKKKGFKLEVSGNNDGYHIEYWKEEI